MFRFQYICQLNILDEGAQYKVCKFAGEMRIGGRGSCNKNVSTLQQDKDKLRQWVENVKWRKNRVADFRKRNLKADYNLNGEKLHM